MREKLTALELKQLQKNEALRHWEGQIHLANDKWAGFSENEKRNLIDLANEKIEELKKP